MGKNNASFPAVAINLGEGETRKKATVRNGQSTKSRLLTQRGGIKEALKKKGLGRSLQSRDSQVRQIKGKRSIKRFYRL